jgi:hypothetical protein
MSLDTKNEAQQQAADAPGRFREQERQVLTYSQAKAGNTGAAKFEGMFKAREGAFGGVFAKQDTTSGEDKAKQAEVLNHLKTIYEGTKTDVDGILDALSASVDSIFSVQVELAKQIFESRVESQLDDIYGFFKVDDWLFGEDTEAIEEVFRVEKERFLTTMDGVIDQIAVLIANMLNVAIRRIEKGRSDAQTYFDGLSVDQQRLSKEAMGAFIVQFDTLEDSVRDKQQELAETLAEAYKSNVDSLQESFDKIKEEVSKGWVQKAADFIAEVASTIKKLAKLLWSVLSRIGNVIGDILAHPIRFIENLAEGIGKGLSKFIDKIDEYLVAGFFDWLRGTVGGPGIKLPDKFDAAGIFSLVTQVLGLSFDTFRKIAVKVWGKASVEMLEKGAAVAEKGLEFFQIVREKGLGGLWDYIVETIGNQVDEILTKVKETILYETIKKALAFIATLFTPAGAFIKAAQAIYAGIRFLIDNIDRIAEIVDAFLSSVELAVAGKTDAISQKIVKALQGAIVLAIDFLAKLLRLGNLADKVRKILNAIRKPVERAIEAVLKRLKPLVRRILKRFGVGAKDDKEKRGPLTREEIITQVVGLMKQPTKATMPAAALAEKKEQAQNLLKKYQPMLKKGQLKITITDPSAAAVEKDAAVDFDVSASPGTEGEAPVGGATVPVPRMVVTPAFSDQRATSMTVHFLHNDPNNHPPGYPVSGKESLLGAWDKLEELGLSRKYWKCGHMLNAKFGGPAKNSNLIPIPQSVNRLHETAFDNKVAKALYEPKKPIWMRFTVGREHPEDKEEQHFVSYFKAEAGEMPLHGDKYEVPTKGILEFEKSGAELPYPAPRTTTLTLNGMIESKDQSRKSVRDMARATLLSDRLVRDLVARGEVLNDVKDIETLIRAKYTGKRLKDYLVNLQDAKLQYVGGSFKL